MDVSSRQTQVSQYFAIIIYMYFWSFQWLFFVQKKMFGSFIVSHPQNVSQHWSHFGLPEVLNSWVLDQDWAAQHMIPYNWLIHFVFVGAVWALFPTYWPVSNTNACLCLLVSWPNDFKNNFRSPLNCKWVQGLGNIVGWFKRTTM